MYTQEHSNYMRQCKFISLVTEIASQIYIYQKIIFFIYQSFFNKRVKMLYNQEDKALE